MIKYKTGGWNSLIEKIEVLRESEKFVFLEGFQGRPFREAKRSSYHNYFDTWDEAFDFILTDAKNNLLRCQHALNNAEKKVNEILILKPDE